MLVFFNKRTFIFVLWLGYYLALFREKSVFRDVFSFSYFGIRNTGIYFSCLAPKNKRFFDLHKLAVSNTKNLTSAQVFSAPTS